MSNSPSIPTLPDLESIRRCFPGLARQVRDQPAVMFDGPAGSQVPSSVAEAMSRYLLESNANGGGVFETSVASDALLDQAQQVSADFFGVDNGHEIVFGANMTTLTFALSRAMAQTWGPGDEIMVTQLDHDANVTPWVRAAQDRGATVQQVKLRPGDCTLDLDDFRSKLSPKTKLVAFAAASNAVGTINPVRQLADWSHEVGALIYVDAVHAAPHVPICATEWDADFVVASAYKFFGPHIGILWGRQELLSRWSPYKVRPAPDSGPGRWSSGTENFEGIAGTVAAMDYLANLGTASDAQDRRSRLLQAFAAIRAHETALCSQLLQGLSQLERIKVWGITDLDRLDQRVSTISFTHDSHPSKRVAEHLAQHGIFAWHGNFYALPLTQALDLEPDGMLRVGLLHYNTSDEVQRLVDAVRELG